MAKDDSNDEVVKLNKCDQDSLIWARIARYLPWPGLVMNEEDAKLLNESKIENKKEEENAKLIYFLGTYQHFWVSAKQIITYADGLKKKFHRKSKGKLFQRSIKEAKDFLEHGEYPKNFLDLDQSDSLSETKSESDKESDNNQIAKANKDITNIKNQKCTDNGTKIESRQSQASKSNGKNKPSAEKRKPDNEEDNKVIATGKKAKKDKIVKDEPLTKKEEGRQRCFEVMQKLGLAPP